MANHEMTEKEMFDALDGMNKLMIKKHEQDELINKKWLDELKKYITGYKIKKIIEFLQEDCGEWWLDGLVEKKDVFGNKQEEHSWFKYIYIRQTTGHVCDDYSGTIFIPIINDLFLKIEYHY